MAHLLEAIYQDRSHGIAGFYIATLIKQNKIHQADYFRDSVNTWFGPGTRSEVLLMTSAQFAIDRHDQLSKLDVDSINSYVMTIFRNWFINKVRDTKRQENYKKVVMNHCRDFHQRSYTLEQEVDKMITEKQLELITTFVKTKNIQDKFIYKEMIGIEKLAYNEAKTHVLNFPLKDSLSRQGYYLRKRKFKSELREFLASQEVE